MDNKLNQQVNILPHSKMTINIFLLSIFKNKNKICIKFSVFDGYDDNRLFIICGNILIGKMEIAIYRFAD